MPWDFRQQRRERRERRKNKGNLAMPAPISNSTAWLQQLDEQGFIVLPGVFEGAAAAAILHALEGALTCDQAGSTLRAGAGAIYGARNVLQLWPAARDVWHKPPLPELLRAVLGPEYGLVRTLYFDKPPEQSWALPWHKDMTIAVRDNRCQC